MLLLQARLSETSDLNSELTALNAYAAKGAAGKYLPALTAVDETVTELSDAAVTSYLDKLGKLSYPLALDETGRWPTATASRTSPGWCW
jgi:hypothetical protein